MRLKRSAQSIDQKNPLLFNPLILYPYDSTSISQSTITSKKKNWKDIDGC